MAEFLPMINYGTVAYPDRNTMLNICARREALAANGGFAPFYSMVADPEQAVRGREVCESLEILERNNGFWAARQGFIADRLQDVIDLATEAEQECMSVAGHGVYYAMEDVKQAQVSSFQARLASLLNSVFQNEYVFASVRDGSAPVTDCKLPPPVGPQNPEAANIDSEAPPPGGVQSPEGKVAAGSGGGTMLRINYHLYIPAAAATVEDPGIRRLTRALQTMSEGADLHDGTEGDSSVCVHEIREAIVELGGARSRVLAGAHMIEAAVKQIRYHRDYMQKIYFQAAARDEGQALIEYQESVSTLKIMDQLAAARLSRQQYFLEAFAKL